MAIALACIKSKPDHMSASEYTEKLCQEYRHQHHTCNDRLKSAENEILQLRQQLVLQSSFRQNRESVVHPSLPTSGESPLMETDDTVSNNHQLNSTENSSSMIQNTAFLQSILNLQTVTRTPQLTSVTLKTINNSLTMIKQCIENEASISLSSLQRNVHVITNVLDSEQFVDLVQVVNCVLDIITCVLNSLLSKDHECMVEVELHVRLLTSFCHFRLFEKMVKMLMSRITELSNHLRDICLKKENIQVLLYWNSNHLFHLLRNILHKHRQHTVMKSSDFLHALTDNLDQSLLHLTDSFPLFAHAVWGIQEILRKAS